MTAKILNREKLTDGYVKVDRMRLRLPTGEEVVRELEHHGAAVAVLPFDAARRCALVVRLFRLPAFEVAGLESLEEACAGMIEDGDEEATARKECEEELGYRIGDLERVARVWPSPGVSTETCTLFLAPYTPADRIGAGGGLAHEHENITVVERRLADLAADAELGLIADGKLLTLVLALRLRRPELF